MIPKDTKIKNDNSGTWGSPDPEAFMFKIDRKKKRISKHRQEQGLPEYQYYPW